MIITSAQARQEFRNRVILPSRVDISVEISIEILMPEVECSYVIAKEGKIKECVLTATALPKSSCE
jgi:hypothetical protein